jgi:sulfane dehydrogenase subunit SoxC
MSEWSSVAFDDKARRIIEEMKAAEARHMSERHAQEEECACKGGMFPTRAPANRRAFLFAAGSTAGGAAAAALGGATHAA